MKYNFCDMTKSEILLDCRVMFIFGQYNMFNNILIDTIKENCSEDSLTVSIKGMIEGYEDEDESPIKISNSVPIDTFMTVVGSPSLVGKWFCSANLSTMTKKQVDWLKNYIKDPSKNGFLVIYCTEYKNYRIWLQNRQITNDKFVSIIQLSFPDRSTLQKIIYNEFNKRHVRIDPRAVELFVIRMSRSYDDYETVIEKICSEHLPSDYLITNKTYEISYEQAFESLRGIENFVIDDFVEHLTKPLTSETPSNRKLIFRIAGYLIEEYGAKKLVNVLSKKVDELIEFRLAINSGYIPILVNGYSISEAKGLIGKDNPISDKSDYQFRRLANISSQLPLMEWVHIKMLLMNVSKFNEASHFKAIYSVITRNVLPQSRIDNDICAVNLLESDMSTVMKIPYAEKLEVGEVVG